LGIILLEDESLETENFIFYGATIWSKPSDIIFKKMNDKFTFRSRDEIINIHEKSVCLLDKFIKEYGGIKPLIIITHHLPSFTLIDKEYECYKELNTGFASELDYLITHPITHWIYGHTHKPNDSIINNVKMICNPLGYIYEGNILQDKIISF
jgi:hypothetical protein